jgi:hypothetical protein
VLLLGNSCTNELGIWYAAGAALALTQGASAKANNKGNIAAARLTTIEKIIGKNSLTKA